MKETAKIVIQSVTGSTDAWLAKSLIDQYCRNLSQSRKNRLSQREIAIN